MDIYRKAMDALRAARGAGSNQAQLIALTEKVVSLARLNLGQQQPQGDDVVSMNMRALQRGCDSLVIKASKFVISYTSKPDILQRLVARKAAEEIHKLDEKAQELLDRFERYGITISQEVAPPATAQVPIPQPTFLRQLSTILAVSRRPSVVINNNITTLVASNVGNETTVAMENVANNNPSTTLVRGDMENTYYSDVVYEDP